MANNTLDKAIEAEPLQPLLLQAHILDVTDSAVCSKMELTESLSSSPLLKMLLRCLVIAGRFVPKRSAICCWVSHTVSVLNVNLEKPLEEYGGGALLLCFRSGLIRASS